MSGSAGVESIPAWLALDEQLTTSGQPSEAQLADIAARGIECVINLALHSHEKALPDEVASVAALGMEYVHIPVAFDNPTDEDFTRFCDVMTEKAGAAVHVHCIINFRVSAFIYRWRRDVLGWDESKAQSDLLKIWDPSSMPEQAHWAAFIARR